MTPTNRLEAGLSNLQSSGCQIQATVQNVKRAYERQANQADQRLREKQASERKRLSS